MYMYLDCILFILYIMYVCAVYVSSASVLGGYIHVLHTCVHWVGFICMYVFCIHAY